MARRVVLSALALVATVSAGCASTHANGSRPASRGESAGSAQAGPSRAMARGGDTAHAGYGATAQRLAARVPGCAERDVDVPTAGTDLGLPHGQRLITRASSAATCTLQGRTALLLSYSSRHDEAAAAAAAHEMTAYFASGPGWLAVPLDLSEPIGQQSVVQDIALALAGSIRIGAKAPRVPGTGR